MGQAALATVQNLPAQVFFLTRVHSFAFGEPASLRRPRLFFTFNNLSYGCFLLVLCSRVSHGVWETPRLVSDRWLTAGGLRKVETSEVTGCKKALRVLGLAILEQREQYCTRHGEQDRFQLVSRHYRYFYHGWTTRTRGSGASRSSA
ncbi:unnamed protein product [Ixodes persulcatus]